MSRQTKKETDRRYYLKNKEAVRARNLKGTRSRRERNREIARLYKADHLCPCGEDNLRILTFHHRIPSEKLADVSRLVTTGAAVKRLVAEILKCDVLCWNCHMKRECKEQGWDSFGKANKVWTDGNFTWVKCLEQSNAFPFGEVPDEYHNL